ncbi:MAG: hypothetical protein ABI644_02990 [Arenimonas sp.]
MTKASVTHHSIFALTFLFSLSFNAFADSSALPMALESKDPEKPLEIMLDKTWTGKEVQAQAGEWSNLGLGDFKVDPTKGPVTLLIDYAATRPDDEDGEAIIDIGIECAQEESGDPCSIPIGDSVVGIRTAFMGESAIKINGAPEAVWVGREFHSYSLPLGTAAVSLTLNSRKNLEPKAIRARLFYGDFDRSTLPGQASRFGIFKMIGISVLLGLIGFFWWVRRQ